MIEYRKLKNDEVEQYIKEINLLYGQLSSHHKEISSERLYAVLGSENSFVTGAFDGQKLVGVGSLHIVKMIGGSKGLIEEVVVDGNYRRQGIAKTLMHKIIEEGKTLGLKYLDLTSNPKREAANKLYQSLGFDLRGTNCYRFNIGNG